jgi:hypothetical protein
MVGRPRSDRGLHALVRHFHPLHPFHDRGVRLDGGRLPAAVKAFPTTEEFGAMTGEELKSFFSAYVVFENPRARIADHQLMMAATLLDAGWKPNRTGKNKRLPFSQWWWRQPPRDPRYKGQKHYSTSKAYLELTREREWALEDAQLQSSRPLHLHV